jgi:hypothetical protein
VLSKVFLLTIPPCPKFCLKLFFNPLGASIVILIPALSNETGKELSDFELKNNLNCLSISTPGRLKLIK